jgi:hypothetical protein
VDNRLLGIYQNQIQSQCEFALIAIQGINEALVVLGAGPSDSGQPGTSEDFAKARDHLWFFVNGLLNSAANISKLLWPATSSKHPLREQRGEALRQSLGVPADSPLKQRNVRNHFEHVDERIETWWDESTNHNIATRTIGPLGALGPLELGEIFEQFDPSALTVAFQGDKFELQPIADEISALLEAASAAFNARYGLNPSE